MRRAGRRCRCRAADADADAGFASRDFPCFQHRVREQCKAPSEGLDATQHTASPRLRRLLDGWAGVTELPEDTHRATRLMHRNSSLRRNRHSCNGGRPPVGYEGARKASRDFPDQTSIKHSCTVGASAGLQPHLKPRVGEAAMEPAATRQNPTIAGWTARLSSQS